MKTGLILFLIIGALVVLVVKFRKHNPKDAALMDKGMDKAADLAGKGVDEAKKVADELRGKGK